MSAASSYDEGCRLLERLISEEQTLATLSRDVFRIIELISWDEHDEACSSFLESIKLIALSQQVKAVVPGGSIRVPNKKRKTAPSTTMTTTAGDSPSSSSSSSAPVSPPPPASLNEDEEKDDDEEEKEVKSAPVPTPAPVEEKKTPKTPKNQKAGDAHPPRGRPKTGMIRKGTAVVTEMDDGSISFYYFDKSENQSGKPLSAEQIKSLQPSSLLLCNITDAGCTFENAMCLSNPATIPNGKQWMLDADDNDLSIVRAFVSFADRRCVPVFFDVDLAILPGSGKPKGIVLPSIPVKVDSKTGVQRVESTHCSNYISDFKGPEFKKLGAWKKYDKIISTIRQLTPLPLPPALPVRDAEESKRSGVQDGESSSDDDDE